VFNYIVKKDSILQDRYFSQSYRGEGGISTFVFGFSFKPSNKFSFGARLDYFFGTITNFWETNFGSSEFFFSTIKRERNYSGLGLTVGLAYGLGVSKNSLTFGLTFSSPVTLKGTSTIEYYLPIVFSINGI
jgi:hypothetical protein